MRGKVKERRRGTIQQLLRYGGHMLRRFDCDNRFDRRPQLIRRPSNVITVMRRERERREEGEEKERAAQLKTIMKKELGRGKMKAHRVKKR